MQPYTVSLLHMNLKVRIFKDAVRLSGKQHALCLQLPTILQLHVTISTVSPSICHEVMGPDAMIFVF